MPYAPLVNDTSGQILAEHQVNAAQTLQQGQEKLGQGIGSALSSVGGGIAGGMTKARENAIKYDAAAGMMDTYKTNAKALGLDMQMLDGIEQKYANDPNKLIGALTVLDRVAAHNMDVVKAQKTYEALGNAYTGKAAATAAAQAAQPPKMNAETIRAFAADAAAQGATPDQIKAGLLKGYGQWAVDTVYPQPKQNLFWGP
jgi:hypothetical protein